MKMSSWHWTQFLVTFVLGSVFATGGCSYDASQLRALPGTGGATGSDGPTATGGVASSDAAAATAADVLAVAGTADAGSVDGGANDLVTPFPDGPQYAQPDTSEGTGKDGVTVVGGADAGDLDSSSDCGNGVLDPGEQCDDRNIQSGDGCSSTCQIEPGWSCTGSPSVCARTVCGNGILEAGEVCDCGHRSDEVADGMHGAERPVQRRRHRLLEDLH